MVSAFVWNTSQKKNKRYCWKRRDPANQLRCMKPFLKNWWYFLYQLVNAGFFPFFFLQISNTWKFTVHPTATPQPGSSATTDPWHSKHHAHDALPWSSERCCWWRQRWWQVAMLLFFTLAIFLFGGFCFWFCSCLLTCFCFCFGFCRCFLVCVVIVVSRWEELLHHKSQACSTVSMYAMCTNEHLYKDCQGPRVYYLYKYKTDHHNIYIYVCIYVYICMYLYILYVYMYIYMFTYTIYIYTFVSRRQQPSSCIKFDSVATFGENNVFIGCAHVQLNLSVYMHMRTWKLGRVLQHQTTIPKCEGLALSQGTTQISSLKSRTKNNNVNGKRCGVLFGFGNLEIWFGFIGFF